MKILYIITQFGVGGAERVLLNLAHEMQVNGHDVYIISLLPVSGMENNDIKIVFLDFKNNFFKSFFMLKKSIVNISPDVVHSHCLHANVIVRLIKIITPIKKLISSAHSSNEGNGIFMKLYKYTNFISDFNTNVSDAAVKKYIDNGYIRKDKISTVYNVVDISKYDFCEKSRVEYREKYKLKNTNVLISIGSLKDAKDYPLLINAISLLKLKKTIKFKQFIVGAGPLEKELKKMVNDLNLGDEIIFLGNRTDIKELLSMADIFILSSKYEGLPTVLMEAIMAENIIVSTACEGVVEIMNNQKFISPICDCISLERNIEKSIIFLNSSDKENYLKGNKEYVKEKFSKENVFQKWVSIYEK